MIWLIEKLQTPDRAWHTNRFLVFVFFLIDALHINSHIINNEANFGSFAISYMKRDEATLHNRAVAANNALGKWLQIKYHFYVIQPRVALQQLIAKCAPCPRFRWC